MKNLRRVLLLVAALFAIAGVADYAYASFTHGFSFPGIQHFSSPCSTVTASDTAPIVPGSSGTLIMICNVNSASNPAINVIGVVNITETPNFQLASWMNSISLGSHGATNECSGTIALSSNVAVTIPAGSYDYCVPYSSYPSNPNTGFGVSWTP